MKFYSQGLLNAARNGDLSKIKHKLRWLADIESGSNVGRTALSLAVSHNHLECVKYLLEQGASMYNQYNDASAFRLAISDDHVDILVALLDHGADVNQRFTQSLTALIEASYHGHIACAKVLIEHGADKFAISESGLDPMLAAITKGHKAIAELLVDNGVDPFVGNGVSLSPFDYAKSRNRQDIAESIAALFKSKQEFEAITAHIQAEDELPESCLLF